MSIAPYIKEIGRGKEGARSLTSEQAHDLMGQVLDGRVTDLEVGAFVMAMRIKGESVDELCGFLQSVHERCIPLSASGPAVILPSYNGARKLPNLTALLALLLAQEGTPVLVHGPASDPGRVTTGSIFHDLGLPTARDANDVRNGWARREPVFMATETLCPPLARLLDVRWVIGLRNPGHTVAKLLDPTVGLRALRVVNHTHPEYGTALMAFLQRSRANAMLLRGTEGEPVADPRRSPRLDVFLHGELRAELSSPAQDGVLTELPVLPRSVDAATTAVYIQSVVSGEKPAPGPLTRQVECIRNALQALADGQDQEMSA
ncbi:MAG: DNA-binding protein YbiB [Pseudomonadota bacterium]|nr:DNA-binding protein YbiB [Pseudomonadota bacterium]